MILRAKHTSGFLDVSSQETLIGETEPFRLTLRPGQTVTVADKYRKLRNIDSAINAGLLEVVVYDSSPGVEVVQDKASRTVETLDGVNDPGSGYTFSLGNHKHDGEGVGDEGSWDATKNYPINSIVGYGGKVWTSLQNNNQNHTPEEGVWWTQSSDHFSIWYSSVNYSINSIVGYNGNVWISLQNNNLNHAPEEGVWWTRVSEQFSIWNSAINYSINSIVGYNGNVWISLQNNNINHTPEVGAWWTAPPHNSLFGLQGGTSGEYYHLTDAEHAAVQAAPNTYLKLDQATPQTIANGQPIFSQGLKITAGQDIRPSADSTSAINFANASGTDLISIDTTNGRLGIGTTTPSEKLEVYGGSGTNPTIIINGGVNGSAARLQLTSAGQDWRFSNQNNFLSGALTIEYEASTLATFLTGGNFGLGTTAPTKRLSVWGGDQDIADPTDLGNESLTNPDLTGGTSWAVTNDCALASDAATWTFSAGTASTLTQTSATLAVVGFGSRWYKFTYTVSAVSGSPTANITTAFASATTSLTVSAGSQTIYFKSATSPANFVITSTLTAGQAFTLDTFSLKEVQGGDISLGGNISIGNTTYSNNTGVIYKGASRFIHDFNYGNNGVLTTSGFNTFVGINAGNFTMGSTAADAWRASYNTGIGNGALQGLTTGFYNVAIGYNAGYTLTTGGSNVLVGRRAMQSATMSTGVVAIGLESCFSNVTGTGGTYVGASSGYYVNDTATPWTNYSTGIGYEALKGSSTAANNTGNYNTAVGHGSLKSYTTATKNTSLGYYTMPFATVGGSNTAIGSETAYMNVSGTGGTYVGYNAGYYVNDTAVAWTNYSVAVGYEALRGSTTAANNTGNYNTAVGYTALRSYTSGSSNIGIGHQSLYSLTSGSYNIGICGDSVGNTTVGGGNIGIGLNAAFTNVSGSYGIYIGYSSGRYVNDTATPWTNYSVGIGYEALKGSSTAANNTGNYNTAVGYQTLFAYTTGNNNSAFGYTALGSITTGKRNVACGAEALYPLTTTDLNIAFGYQAGRYITGGATANITPSNSIYLGSNTKANADSETNQIVIGYDATGLGSNTVVLGNSSITKTALRGIVGINCTAPDKQLEINSATGNCLRLTYNDADGSATNYADLLVSSGGILTITASGGTINPSPIDMQDGLITRPELKDYSETVNALGDVTTAATIDITLGNVVTATSTGDTAWTFSNPSPTGKACSFTLILTNGGAFAQTWPSPNTKWASGIAPTLTVSGVDVIVFMTIDAGTTWRGTVSSKDSK